MIRPDEPILPAPARHRAFVTGFPRQLSRGLTVQLLNRHPETRVQLLLDRSVHDARDRAEAFLETVDVHHQRPESPSLRARIDLIDGHVNDVDLGLSGADARRMLELTTLIMQADARQAGGRAELRRHNVEAVRSMLTLARDMPNLRRYCLFSTAFVSGRRAGRIAEEDLDGAAGFRTPYERTMFDAEQVVRELMPWVPATVFRPSAMIGHSRTGDTDDHDEGPSYLLELLVALPTEVPLLLPGSGVAPFNLVPVDYVVRAACDLADRPESCGRTLHLTDPHPLSARRVVEILSDATERPGPVTGALPTAVLQRVLQLPGIERLARRPLSALDGLRGQVMYDCGGAMDLLRGTGIACPPFETYADYLVEWVTARQRAKRVEKMAPVFEASDV